MFNVQQLREFIIRPALHDLVLYSEEAEELLVFTCAVESDGGTFLKQIKGPALGIYQMEPNTYIDLWENYIKNKVSLSTLLNVNFDCHRIPSEERLIYDLRFATALARIYYARIPQALPLKDNVLSLWNYYKIHYNTQLGDAQQDVAIRKYLAFLNT